MLWLYVFYGKLSVHKYASWVQVFIATVVYRKWWGSYTIHACIRTNHIFAESNLWVCGELCIWLPLICTRIVHSFFCGLSGFAGIWSRSLYIFYRTNVKYDEIETWKWRKRQNARYKHIILVWCDWYVVVDNAEKLLWFSIWPILVQWESWVLIKHVPIHTLNIFLVKMVSFFIVWSAKTTIKLDFTCRMIIWGQFKNANLLDTKRTCVTANCTCISSYWFYLEKTIKRMSFGG